MRRSARFASRCIIHLLKVRQQKERKGEERKCKLLALSSSGCGRENSRAGFVEKVAVQVRRHDVGVQIGKKIWTASQVVVENGPPGKLLAVFFLCGYVASTHQKKQEGEEIEQEAGAAALMRTFANVASMNLTRHQ